ncbi:MAG: transposase [Coleofasciculus sp. S288]|nr:transposase [Coleofasciculus sp. S288]
MTVCAVELPYDFAPPRRLEVKLSALELKSDAGILLARQAEEKVNVCEGLAACIEE